MRVAIHPLNPQPREIAKVIEVLEAGGVIVIPTDSVYAFACDSNSSKAIDQMCVLSGKKPEKANFSMLFQSLSQVSEYTMPISNEVFKLMRRNTPGPFTFIMQANSQVPRIFRNSKKKTLGVRIPNHLVVQELVTQLNRPIVCSSLHDENHPTEFLSDPDEIYDLLQNRVDAFVESGSVGLDPSAIIDVTGKEPVIIREGTEELI